MENSEPQQVAMLTDEESKFIKAFRCLAESEKAEIIEQINNIKCDYESNEESPYRKTIKVNR